MNKLKFIPIPQLICDPVRIGLKTQGSQASLKISDGGFPCRSCLNNIAEGDEAILFTYSPFLQKSPYFSQGPVFIHKTACLSYSAKPDVPEIIRHSLLSIRFYNTREELIKATVLPGEEIETPFKDNRDIENTSVIHIHFARPGCFAVKCHV